MAKVLVSTQLVVNQAKRLFTEERAIQRLDGWFLAREISANYAQQHLYEPTVLQAANALCAVVEQLPLKCNLRRNTTGCFCQELCTHQSEFQSEYLQRLLRPYRRIQ